MRRLLVLCVLGGGIAVASASAAPMVDNSTLPAGSISVLQPPIAKRTANTWQGFVSPVTDASTHTVNVIRNGYYIAVYFKLGGPVFHGDPTSEISIAGNKDADCATWANYPHHDVLPTSDTFTDDWYAGGSKYGFEFVTYPDELGDCLTLTVTLLDGSEHSALFKIVQ